MSSEQLPAAVTQVDVKLTAPKAGRPANRLRVTLVLLCLMAVIALQRCHTWNEPLERDMPTYAVVAHEVMGGRALYSDVFDQKPPAVYATYALAEKVFGYGQPAVELLGVLAAWITLFGVFTAAFRLSCRSTICGFVAAAAWVVIGSDLHLQANQPNTEVFMNACIIWAIAILARFYPKPPDVSASICIGLLTTLATLYKPVVVAVPLCVCFGVAASSWVDSGKRKAAVTFGAIVCGVVIVSWILTALYFRIENRFDPFYYAMVIYNRSYSGSIGHNLLNSLQPRKIFPPGSQAWMYAALVILAACAYYGLRTLQKGVWVIAISYAIGVQAAIALPGRFFAHYYQLWLPLLSIGAGCAFEYLKQIPNLQQRYRAMAAVIVLATCIVVREAWSYTLPADEWSIQKYGGDCVDARWVGKHINSWLTPNEIYYDAGMDPQFYFYSKRRILSGVFYSEAITGKPRANAFAERVFAELRANPPDLVTTDRVTGRLDLRVLQWLDTNYVRVSVPGHDKYFGFFLRRGSQAEARLGKLLEDGTSLH